ncbi:hypothetical protein [Streptomyces natalensis]|uniref:hypothetical protein n=1 Tax=Streptomyces natalensis TaxID=68242 RepID=UPI0012FEC762|nr:hypothetical protein [Streptomyces natalensis]
MNRDVIGMAHASFSSAFTSRSRPAIPCYRGIFFRMTGPVRDRHQQEGTQQSAHAPANLCQAAPKVNGFLLGGRRPGTGERQRQEPTSRMGAFRRPQRRYERKPELFHASAGIAGTSFVIDVSADNSTHDRSRSAPLGRNVRHLLQ